MEHHDRDVRFLLPDEFAGLGDDERDERLSGDDTFLRIDDDRFFVRSIVPIELSGAHLIAYAVWVETDVDEMRHAYGVWDQPAYASITIHGHLANALPPWPEESLRASVVAQPRHLDELPYVVGSSDEEFARILDTTWPHEVVLETFDE